MTAERYSIDTNILVYAVDPAEGWKHEIATVIVDRSIERPCILTVQALAEFVAVATRRRKRSAADAVEQARDWLRVFPVVGTDAGALEAACGILEARRLSLWDALLVMTARAAGCTVILSEDMHDGSGFGGITVRNPLVERGMPDDLKALVGLS